GFGAATPLPLIGAVRRDADAAHGCRRRVLAAGLYDRLAAFTRSHAITPSTFFQAVWALLLARYTGHRDLVFGTTVAGRPAELAGVDTMVGMFINTLPVRIDVTPGLPVVAWMQRIQTEAAEAREFEHASLSQIHGWSEIARGVPLFETLLVYENFPALQPAGRSSLAVAAPQTHDVTSFALDLDIVPGPPYTVIATYARDRYDDATVERILDHLEHAVGQLLARPDARVA